MALYRCQIEIPYDSGLPSDVAVNVWWVQAASLSDAGDFTVALIDFYEAIDEDYSSLVNNGADACSGKLYDMNDPEPRVPAYEFTFTMPAATGAPLPPECCVCLSYAAAPLSGEIAARRRGRVFLGPLDTSCVDATGNVQNATADRIRDAAQALLDASDAAANWAWHMWSPSDQEAKLITHGWVDNEFDTQRRRGRDATSRLTFTQ